VICTGCTLSLQLGKEIINKCNKQKENDGILLYAVTEKHKKDSRTVQKKQVAV
jgi:hypothetical protein